MRGAEHARKPRRDRSRLLDLMGEGSQTGNKKQTHQADQCSEARDEQKELNGGCRPARAILADERPARS